MLVFATWALPPRRRWLISFLSIAYEIAVRIAGSDAGQPGPRSATAGLREQPPFLIDWSKSVLGDQFGRRNSYRRAGMAATWSPRSWTFGMSESWRSNARSISPARKPAIIASGSPYHLNTTESRYAGLLVPKPLYWSLRTSRSSACGVTDSNLNGPGTGSLAMSLTLKPLPLTWSAIGIFDR